MKYNNSVITISKQIMDTLQPLLSEQHDNFDASNFDNLVRDLVKELGEDRNIFNEKRKIKIEKNGAFLIGYVLIEKVLPIGEGSFQHKLNRDDRKDTASGAQKVIAITSDNGIRSIPEKLVRDRIPEQVETQAVINGIKDYEAKTRIVKGEEKKKWLREKLREESTEFFASTQNGDSVHEVLEDLGDTADLVYAIMNSK